VSDRGDVELALEDIVKFRRSGEPTMAMRTCARLRHAGASAGPWLVVPVDGVDARAIEFGAAPADPLAAILPHVGMGLVDAASCASDPTPGRARWSWKRSANR
jgi:hypothetical protein